MIKPNFHSQNLFSPTQTYRVGAPTHIYNSTLKTVNDILITKFQG